MSKNSKARRQSKLQKHRSPSKPSPVRHPARQHQETVTSAQTLWRAMHLDVSIQDEVLATVLRAQPTLWQWDSAQIKHIEQAADVEAVLDLVPTALGLAYYAWLKRMRELGPSAAEAIAERLTGGWLDDHPSARAGIQERCIGALRWCDNRHAGALVRCWDAFDDYGRSLGCTLLGLLDVPTEADRVWSHFHTVRSQPNLNFVGSLWGLIDMQDPRAADALADLVSEGRTFHELYGFISRAGDVRLILPLVKEVLKQSHRTSADAMWALTGIAHRLGRDQFLSVILDDDANESDRERAAAFVDQIFIYDQEAVERNFESFYARTLQHPLDETSDLRPRQKN